MRNKRQKLKMSQYRLAELVETSGWYISMIESCKKCPSPEMIMRIAESLGIDTPELFSMDSFPGESLRKYQKEILKLIGSVAEQVLEQKLEQLNRKK